MQPGGGDAAGLEDWVCRMRDRLAHRGPDARGAWADPAAGLALGHSRLSIIDRSALGGQPMVSGDGRYVLVLNGEIYNFPALRIELESLGRSFRGHSDTEVLLEAIAHWGIREALKKSAGMFAFAVWDRRERRLTLARDRMGEKPLYYGWNGDTFLFGSELKALRAHPRWSGTVDRGALAAYLRHGYVPAPLSIYDGIRKLRPGTLLEIAAGEGPGAERESAYWSLRAAAETGNAAPFAGSAVEAVDALERSLLESVRERVLADVPVGVFLSGGLDSSVVAALMQAQSRAPVPTFTLAFGEKDFNEAPFARAVAAHLGTDHHEFLMGAQEALAILPALPSLYDEPFADPSQIPTAWLARLTKPHATVCLTGDGADELLGGYARYGKGDVLRRRFLALPRAARWILRNTLLRIPPARREAFLHGLGDRLPAPLRARDPGGKAARLADLLDYRSAESTYLETVSFWKHPENLARGAREPGLLLRDPAAWPAFGDFGDLMMYLDQLSYLPDDILVKTDRAGMASGLELRAPFLDHRLVEFLWTLPHALKVRPGKEPYAEKWILRRVLDRHVPPALTERPKRGFGVPLGAWLRGPLREWADALLDARSLEEAGFLDAGRVRRTWEEHVRGTRDRATLLWPVLMFQAWLQAEK
jgi:asparagine synthase (glutamine-hydrolysing)